MQIIILILAISQKQGSLRISLFFAFFFTILHFVQVQTFKDHFMRNLFLFLLMFEVLPVTIFPQVSINTDGAPPDSSAMLDIKSTSKGMLIPRMTTDQIGAIITPADGLLVYNTDNGKVYVFVSSTSAWREINYGSGSIPVCPDTFTDPRDSVIYHTVIIGSQCWMKENLNTGTRIDAINEQSDNLLIEKYCWNDEIEGCLTYGGLYQWNELMNYTASSDSNPSGRQGICPVGWHVPGSAEWCQMELYLDATVDCISSGMRGTDAGGSLKETGTAHWLSPNTGATNSSGFTAFAGGWRQTDGSFFGPGTAGCFWTTSEASPEVGVYRYLYNVSAQVGLFNGWKSAGMSARCVKD